MSTKTKQTTTPAALEAYVDRHLPDYLREGTSPPPSWAASVDEWAEAARVARTWHRARLTADFARLVSEGWTPSEIEAGRLQSGHVGAGGVVVRPQPATVTRALADRAHQALTDCRALLITLGGGLPSTLREIAAGGWRGMPSAAEAAVASAESMVRAKRAELQAQAAERAADTVQVTVTTAFRGPAGKHYQPGQQTVPQDEAEALRVWLQRMEAERQQSPDTRPEFRNGWPPFTIDN